MIKVFWLSKQKKKQGKKSREKIMSAVSPADIKSFSQDNEVLSSHGEKVPQKDSGLSDTNVSVTLKMFKKSLRAPIPGADIQRMDAGRNTSLLNIACLPLATHRKHCYRAKENICFSN